MKILMAEDDRATRWTLETIAKKGSHEVIATSSGKRAWEVLQGEGPPLSSIIDRMMLEVSGA
jgi:CheY-like chemotaxis protein